MSSPRRSPRAAATAPSAAATPRAAPAAPRAAAAAASRAAAAAPAAPPARAAATARHAYHHGALREALIEASDALLAERGPEGFSLREVARRSGVSAAAPAHHFGDMAGLLTAVATLAFQGLHSGLEEGNARGGTDAVARLREQGLGYVGFALRHPGRFGLMFRGGLKKDEPLERAAHAAFLALEDGVRALVGTAPGAALAPAHWQALVAIWSVVHGFAHLALAGQFARALPGLGREALLRDLLAPMLDHQLRALQAQAAAGPPAAPVGARPVACAPTPPRRRRAGATSGSR